MGPGLVFDMPKKNISDFTCDDDDNRKQNRKKKKSPDQNLRSTKNLKIRGVLQSQKYKEDLGHFLRVINFAEMMAPDAEFEG